jgi:UDP-N-acetyl-D-mannosaminuronate dehydrogenase
MSQKVIVVGVGEVGGPLLDLLRTQFEAHGVDIGTPDPLPACDIMHICFPYKGDGNDFVKESVRYIQKFRPSLTIVNSTVGVGTTRRIVEVSRATVVYSPVRGKHAKMKQDMLHYVKFVGAIDPAVGKRACEHFEKTGMRTKLVSTPEAAELAKLTETTYFGVLIAWAQEVERYCKATGANYDEVISFYEEIKFFPPVKYFPGVIGGHCVMPNIEILRRKFSSDILEAVVKSNEVKKSQT